MDWEIDIISDSSVWLLWRVWSPENGVTCQLAGCIGITRMIVGSLVIQMARYPVNGRARGVVQLVTLIHESLWLLVSSLRTGTLNDPCWIVSSASSTIGLSISWHLQNSWDRDRHPSGACLDAPWTMNHHLWWFTCEKFNLHYGLGFRNKEYLQYICVTEENRSHLVYTIRLSRGSKNNRCYPFTDSMLNYYG